MIEFIKKYFPTFIVEFLKKYNRKWNKFREPYAFLNRKVTKPFIKLSVLKQNQFEGKRCVIIGGGPSIKDMDLTTLNDEFTFACNKGYMLEQKGLKRSNIYGMSDFEAMRDYGSEIPEDFYDYFCIFGGAKPIQKFKNLSTYSVYTKYGQNMYDDFFQFDLTKPTAHAFTIMGYLVQLAAWLGFKEIYLIGFDNNFRQVDNMHWYKDTKQEKKNMVVWTHDPAEDNKNAISYAQKQLEKVGVKLINAGIGGNLDIPREDFNEVFKGKK